MRFNKPTRKITVECWPRFADVSDGNAAQYPGWPITFDYRENDGRDVTGLLPEIDAQAMERPVVQVIEESSGEILYTIRTSDPKFRPPVYSEGPFTVKMGQDKPEKTVMTGARPAE